MGNIGISGVWIIGALALACGFALGAATNHLLRGGRRARNLENELSELRTQFDDYRAQVSEHFRGTSKLVQKMTDSYRDVYEHLAGGSQALCQTPVDTANLDFTHRPELAAGPDNRDEVDAEVETELPADPTESSASDDSDIGTLMGDAPRVPRLEPEQAASPRAPSA